MRPLFRPDGCAVNEAGISVAGNPMSQAFDAINSQQRLGGLPAEQSTIGHHGPEMMGPMSRSGRLDAAWQEAGPGHAGPMMGDAMGNQLLQHMQAGPGLPQQAFFQPMQSSPIGSTWAADIGGQSMGPASDWGQEFARQQQRQLGPGSVAASSTQVPMGMMAPPGPVRPMMAPMVPMGPMGMPPQVVAPAPVPAQASQPHATSQHETRQDAEDMTQPRQMVEMLRNSGNPKFANSQFVEFIHQVTTGDLQFKEDTVVDRNGLEVDWDSLYDVDEAAATDKPIDKAWDVSLQRIPEAAAIPELNDPLLEEAWKKAGEDIMGQMQMEDAWRQAQYAFQKENPYQNNDDPLALAMQLLREGRDREALLALEAEVQKHPDSSEGWRQLGQLYAELDQDVEAIHCLQKGHEVDPYNLPTLLALGVSLTNELDQIPALRYLRRWIENHDEHQVLVQGLDPPPDHEFLAWKEQVTALFTKAAEANPTDGDVFVALGVMQNINRNFDGAVRALAMACRQRPSDHTVWNKLGATLANSQRSDQAISAYNQALQLKPNYARSWSNLAIAHANLQAHSDAARFYASSLVLNPDASHIWNFLHTAVLNMDGNSSGPLLDAIDRRDLGACARLIEGVLDPNALPARVEQLPEPADAILTRMGL